MKFAQRKGWPYLIKQAQSDNRELRQVSLIRSYSWVEHALGASGFRRDKKPICVILYEAYKINSKLKTLPSCDLRDAIKTRNLATHMDDVPSPNVCLRAVKVFGFIWDVLNEHYVNVSNAAEIAQAILRKKNVLSVSLFGSLSRSLNGKYKERANDIDFLVLDNGEYSEKIDLSSSKYLDTSKITRKASKLLTLPNFPFDHIINCRWLDIVILDGTKFGKDLTYTYKIASCQPDPYFFLNIAQDTHDFDLNTSRFVDTNIPVFLKLRKVADNLREIGFLEPFDICKTIQRNSSPDNINISDILVSKRDSFETDQEFQARFEQQLYNFNQAVRQHDPRYQAGIAYLDKEGYGIKYQIFPIHIEWQTWAKKFVSFEESYITISRDEAKTLLEEGLQKPLYIYLKPLKGKAEVSKFILTGLKREWTVTPIDIKGHIIREGICIKCGCSADAIVSFGWFCSFRNQ